MTRARPSGPKIPPLVGLCNNSLGAVDPRPARNRSSVRQGAEHGGERQGRGALSYPPKQSARAAGIGNPVWPRLTSSCSPPLWSSNLFFSPSASLFLTLLSCIAARSFFVRSRGEKARSLSLSREHFLFEASSRRSFAYIRIRFFLPAHHLANLSLVARTAVPPASPLAILLWLSWIGRIASLCLGFSVPISLGRSLSCWYVEALLTTKKIPCLTGVSSCWSLSCPPAFWDPGDLESGEIRGVEKPGCWSLAAPAPSPPFEPHD